MTVCDIVDLIDDPIAGRALHIGLRFARKAIRWRCMCEIYFVRMCCRYVSRADNRKKVMCSSRDQRFDLYVCDGTVSVRSPSL